MVHALAKHQQAAFARYFEVEPLAAGIAFATLAEARAMTGWRVHAWVLMEAG
ncbi:MAG: hypothetical protein MUC91_07690 [Verrucomicrobia bacterium]|nr:hypothetical protein [Verrucomicrobiota bacterium]